MRRLLTVVLLAFVAISLAWAYARPRAAPSSDPGTGAVPAPARVVAYYLHGARRCRTCVAIETGGVRALESAFAEELRRGELRHVALDTDVPENAHFVDDFGLTSSSLVLATEDGARHHVLARVWELVGDDAAFDAYVVAATRDALEGRWP